MEKFTLFTGVGAPLRRSNVDTDQIVPAEYLKRVTRTGFADGCFASWRKDPAFVLNQPVYSKAEVLVAGPDFGTGSSREHAVWALQDFGFRAVISSRFADIFRGNSAKTGLVAAQVEQDGVEQAPAVRRIHRVGVVGQAAGRPDHRRQRRGNQVGIRGNRLRLPREIRHASAGKDHPVCCQKQGRLKGTDYHADWNWP